MSLLDSVTGGLFGKKATPQSSPLSDLLANFPELRNVGGDLISRAQQLSTQTAPFMPSEVAGYTPAQQQAMGTLTGYQAPRFNFDFGKKADAAYGMAGNFFSGVSPLISTAQDYFKQGASPITGAELQGGIADFMNPYTDQVINNSVRDIQTYGTGLFSDAKSLMSDAGATGSNRAQFLAGDIADNLMKNVGDVSSNLRNTGFTTAANNALTRLMGDRSNALAAGGGTVNSANAMTSAGTAATNLGSNLFNSRLGVEDIKSSTMNNMLALAKAQLSGGEGERLIQQQANDNQVAVNQIPLQQLQLLQSLFGIFPTGSGGGSAATQGLLSSGGNWVAGIGKAAKLGMGGF